MEESDPVISQRLAFIITAFTQRYEIIGPDGMMWNNPNPIVIKVGRRDILKTLNKLIATETKWMPLTQMSEDWCSFLAKVISERSKTKNGTIFLLIK